MNKETITLREVTRKIMGEESKRCAGSKSETNFP